MKSNFNMMNQNAAFTASAKLSDLGGINKGGSSIDDQLAATGKQYKFKSYDALDRFHSLHSKDRNYIGRTYAWADTSVKPARIHTGHFGWSEALQCLSFCSES